MRAELLDLERDLPTTAEDVEALRRLRRPAGRSLLEHIDDLAAPELFGPLPRRRRTSEGFEPFEL
jgi:hypothetical protein